MFSTFARNLVLLFELTVFNVGYYASHRTTSNVHVRYNYQQIIKRGGRVVELEDLRTMSLQREYRVQRIKNFKKFEAGIFSEGTFTNECISR